MLTLIQLYLSVKEKGNFVYIPVNKIYTISSLYKGTIANDLASYAGIFFFC